VSHAATTHFRSGLSVKALRREDFPASDPSPPIHLAPIAHLDHEDAERAILDVAEDPVIPDPVAPVRAKLRAGQCLARAARIVERRQALPQEDRDASGLGLVQLAELLGCCGGQVNPPGEDPAPPRPA